MVVIWIILGALLLWEIQSVWYAKHWDEDLFVSLSFSRKSTVRGESCELLETIENRKLLPLPALKVKFQVSRQLAFEDAGTESSVTDQYYRNDVFSVRPYTRHIRSLRFTCKKRGFYSINGLDVVAGDLFLTHELPKSLPVDSQLYVYPRPFRGMDFNGALRQLSGEVATKRHLQEDPFEYLGIREYTPRDTLRDVNWKATARSGELKVNQKGCTAQRSVRLVVNLEDGAILRQEDLLEASIEMAAAARHTRHSVSLPAWGAWIEMQFGAMYVQFGNYRRSPHGERGLKYGHAERPERRPEVAPRRGSVD